MAFFCFSRLIFLPDSLQHNLSISDCQAAEVCIGVAFLWIECMLVKLDEYVHFYTIIAL